MPQDDQASIADRYRSMPEPELLAASRDYDQLTDTAQAALRQEFAHRGLEAPLVEDTGDDEPEGARLVTIRRYRDLSEAIVARSLLESAGLYCELRDENLIRLDWQISNFIGGLRLQVPQLDAAAAEELLSQAVVDPIPLDFGGDFRQPRCPHCGSTEITFEGASRGAAITSLFMLAVPLPTGPETWLCSACGTRWEDAG